MSNAIKQFIQNGVQRDLKYGEPVRRAAGVAAIVAASNPTMTQAAGYSAADSYNNAPASVNYNAPARGSFASDEFKNFPTIPTQTQPAAQKTAQATDNFVKRIFARVQAKKAPITYNAPAAKYTRNDTTGIKSQPQDTFRTKNNARAGQNGEETRNVGTAGPQSSVPSQNYNAYAPPPQAPTR